MELEACGKRQAGICSTTCIKLQNDCPTPNLKYKMRNVVQEEVEEYLLGSTSASW
jgi:hypothetical protein